MKKFSLIFILIGFLTINSKSENNNPTELGTVHWLRSYNEAIAKSKTEKKPVLILFQEVPGCSTCRNYGQNVLSNPLLVEAIEEYFIPLAIYNNKGGADAKVLKMYNEPSWNNPVVRIVNAEGKDIVKRVGSNYSKQGLYSAMNNALENYRITPSPYFKLLGLELNSSNSPSVKETYYQMYCFWSGESHLGTKEGVLATEPGFMSGHEVVKVKYDEAKISKEELDLFASKASCSPIKKANNYRVDKDPQYYLKNSKYKYLPLSAIQKTKINSALKLKQDASIYLSPKQKLWLNQAEPKEPLYAIDFEKAWDKRSSF